jgi:hypothetical protein
VSIAIGVPCSDGVVLACDHQYTVGGFTKTAGRKMFAGIKYCEARSYNSVLIVAIDNPESGKKISEALIDALPQGFSFWTLVLLVYDEVQSSKRKPLILENSRVLFVASEAPRLRTVPAINRSSGPIPMPRRSSSRRTRAASRAASRSNGTSSRLASIPERILRRRGLAILRVPYSSSYATTLGIAISEGVAARNREDAVPYP